MAREYEDRREHPDANGRTAQHVDQRAQPRRAARRHGRQRCNLRYERDAAQPGGVFDANGAVGVFVGAAVVLAIAVATIVTGVPKRVETVPERSDAKLGSIG